MSPLVGLVLMVPQAAPPPEVPLPSGVWRAWLDSPGGELRFRFELQADADGMRVWLLNGEERTPASWANTKGDEVTFEWADFDSVLRARILNGGTALAGTWDKQASATTRVQLGFHAQFGDDALAPPPMPMLPPGTRPGSTASQTLTGRYRVHFDGDDAPAVGLLQEGAGGGLTGTFLTVLGDYRYLEGRRAGTDLVLSCFDGGHAFLFHAAIAGDGSLHGKFWSAAAAAQEWNGQRDDTAALPDAFHLARAKFGKVGKVAFQDLTGQTLDLTDPEVLGEGCVMLVFGSWCPNCHDATDTLVALRRRYGARGLRVVGLAFELTDDADRSRRVLQAYAQRHGVEWPILVAGSADKQRAARALPFLDRIVAYPTVVFVAKDGSIRDVYTGFTGPAAASDHQELVLAWRARIEDLLR